jgi:hypothetical protein
VLCRIRLIGLDVLCNVPTFLLVCYRLLAASMNIICSVFLNGEHCALLDTTSVQL